MFEAFRDFLHSIGGESRRGNALDSSDPRVAAAALLFHVGNADGLVSAEERLRLKAVLSQEFGLDPTQTDRIAHAGREADAEAVDLHNFTSVLKNALSEEQRVRFVALLWEVTYADGKVHELEDNLIWRISELLGVSSRDRMLMKKRASGRAQDAD